MAGRPGGVAGALTALAARLIRTEVGERAPETVPQAYALGATVETYTATLDDPPPVSFSPWGGDRADRLARTLGAVVVAGLGPAGEELRNLIDDLSERAVHVEVVEIGAGGADPLWLAGRCFPPPDVSGRREFLRLTGVVPARGAYLVRYFGAGPSGTGAPGADVAVAGLAHRAGLEVCDPGGLGAPLDLVAAVGGAEVVVTDEAALAVVAAALGRPVILVRWPDPDDPPPELGLAAREVDGTDGIRSLTTEWPGPAPADWLDQKVTEAEVLLDDLAGRLAGRARVADPGARPDEMAALRERLAVLEQVNAALRARLNREREAMVARLRAAGAAAPTPPPRPVPPPDTAAVAAVENEARQLRDELDRLYATKTMRMVEPLRRVYGALRVRTR